MRKQLPFSIFIGGFVSMAIEMVTARMISNVFSSANIVWAFVIGSILIYIAVGNAIANKITSSKRLSFHFFLIFLIAGIATALIPILTRPILRFAIQSIRAETFLILTIPFLIVLLLIAPAMILCGMILPLGLAINEQSETKRSQTGNLLAISTIGAFLGTLLPVFVLIPWLGSTRSFFFISFILILVGGSGIARNQKFTARYLMLFLILPITGMVFFPTTLRTSPITLFEKESAYNTIEITEEDGFRLLKINEGLGIQSIDKPGVENYYGPWEQMITGVFFYPAPIQRDHLLQAAILGLAGGTAARQFLSIFPNTEIDGFELDPEITRAAREWLRLDDPRIHIYTMDGRLGLLHSTKQYDIIFVDAYQPPYIAANMCTAEFFQIVDRKLSDHGTLVMNIGQTNNNHALLDAIATTARTSFPNQVIVNLPDRYNAILFAFRDIGQLENLRTNYDNLFQEPTPPILLLETLSIALGNIAHTPQSSPFVLTDDHAPIEWLTHQAIFSAWFSQNQGTILK